MGVGGHNRPYTHFEIFTAIFQCLLYIWFLSGDNLVPNDDRTPTVAVLMKLVYTYLGSMRKFTAST